MNRTVRLVGLGVIVVLLVGAGWLVRERFDEPVGAVAASPNEAASATPLPAAAPILEASGARAVASGEGSSVVPVAEAEPLEPVGGADETVVLVRMFDSEGAPLAGATVRVVDGPVGASGSDGTVRLAWRATEDAESRQIELEARGEGFARDERNAVVRSGETTWLDAWALVAAGTITGRVVDGRGGGLEGARVALAAPLPQMRPWETVQHSPFEILARPGARTRTTVDGTFVLEEVPVGTGRLVASFGKHAAARSDAFELGAGDVLGGIVVVVDTDARSTRVAGRVVDPDGRPVPFAPVEHSSGGGKSSQQTGPAGEFEFVIPAGGACALLARDPSGRYGAAEALDVVAGTLDVELALVRSESLELEVTALDGAPIEAFTARIFGAEPRALLGVVDVEPAGAFGRVPLPERTFAVEVAAEGFLTTEFGPFEPARSGPSLLLALERSSGLRGRVTIDGVPRAGVTVTLHRRLTERRILNGYDIHMDPKPAATARTSDTGEYALTVSEVGEYYARAETDGWAPAEVGPMVLGALGAGGERHADLELQPGATLEVHVGSAAAEHVPGKIVGISRGDGRARTRRTDAEGLAVFTGLEAGPWLVVLAEVETRPGELHTQMGSGPPREPDPTCVLVPGTTTRVELQEDFVSEALRLRGRLRVDGKPAEGWMAQLHAGSSGAVASAPVVDGKFELASDASGTFELIVVKLSENGIIVLRDVVELAGGSTSWRERLETGALSGHVATPVPDGESMFFVWRGAGDLECSTSVSPNEAGEIDAPSVPAGAGRLVRYRMDQSMHEQVGEVLIEVVVKPGETTLIEIP